jgi:site-specific recombinase XerD
MLNNGAPIEVVSKVLGHASVKQTEQVYAKILNKTVERAFDMLEGKLKKEK